MLDKTNYSMGAASLKCAIVPSKYNEKIGVVEWRGEYERTANEHVAAEASQGRQTRTSNRNQIMGFILTELRRMGNEASWRDLADAIESEFSVTERTARRARGDLEAQGDIVVRTEGRETTVRLATTTDFN